MNRIALAIAFLVVLAASSRWMHAQAPAGAGRGQANPPLFSGTTTAMDAKDLSVARRRFEPGARTYWHSHERGQLLMVEAGRMRVQNRGEAMRELGVGGSDYSGPNVVHWHGATPGGSLVQLNVGFGGETKWLEAVSDAEYDARK